jgi:hypothetical protein
MHKMKRTFCLSENSAHFGSPDINGPHVQTRSLREEILWQPEKSNIMNLRRLAMFKNQRSRLFENWIHTRMMILPVGIIVAQPWTVINLDVFLNEVLKTSRRKQIERIYQTKWWSHRFLVCAKENGFDVWQQVKVQRIFVQISAEAKITWLSKE